VRIRSTILIIAAAAGFIALHSCALPAAPTGGPKDETPPQITQSEPAHTQVQISPQEIHIQFDEFVALGSNGGRPISSPPLPGTVRVTLQGKSARIRWDGGPLLPDATYSLALGGCFKDITEGNLLPATALVFATGNQLDSLYWAGRLHDARSGKPLADWAVGLWPADAPDSAAYLGLPRYTSRTDDDGRFALNYLPAGPFRLLAFEDATAIPRSTKAKNRVGRGRPTPLRRVPPRIPQKRARCGPDRSPWRTAVHRGPTAWTRKNPERYD